ncbi:hypothetical protein Tco_0317189 [Tanacetum coccineum]
MQLVLLGEKGKLLLSPQQVVIGDHKDTTGTIALKNKELFDNDVPAHVTETRPNLAEFQDFNVPYAFWRSENQANIHAGQQEANHNAEEEQAFLDELERLKRQEKEANEEAEALRKEFAQETENLVIQEGAAKASSTNIFSIISEIPPLEDIYQNSSDGIFTTSSYDDEGAVADFTNLESIVNVSPIPTCKEISLCILQLFILEIQPQQFQTRS